MIRSTVLYPDGSRQKFNREEREQLELAGLITASGSFYRWIGEAKTYHAFADLAEMRIRLTPQQFKRFLAGLFIWLLNEKRRTERMETAEGLADRQNKPPAGHHCDWDISYAQYQAVERQKAAVLT